MRRFFFILSSMILLTACSNADKHQEAEALLAQANSLYEQNKYVEARACIDSLRRAFPNAIDTRKKALSLYQEIELKHAQEELAKTDSLLQLVQNDLDNQQAKVEKDKAALRATPDELTMLTRTRIKRDSLRTQCETLGAKIRYIHQKMKN